MPDNDLPIYMLPEPMGKLIGQRYGMKCGERRLQKYRLSGDGPPFARDGHDVLYHVEGTLAWAEQKLRASLSTSTSEEAAREQVSVNRSPSRRASASPALPRSPGVVTPRKTGPPASAT
jgi:hypothetical protein